LVVAADTLAAVGLFHSAFLARSADGGEDAAADRQ
jgi:hypothetical protein